MIDRLDTPALLLLVCCAILMLVAALGPCSSVGARADDHSLELAVAKVAVNESGFSSPADVALIWQVTEGRAQTREGRLAWLRRHSSCVLGVGPLDPTSPPPGNCGWTRYLTWSDRQPPGWPEGATWRPEAWARVRRLASALVDGRERRRPCAGTPTTWGGPMDAHRARARGLVPLVCEGTRNTGYRLGPGA